MHHSRSFAILLAAYGVTLLATPRAAAWSAGGHRIVANIAYDRMDAATRSSIVKVLRRHEDFKQRFEKMMPQEVKDGSAADRDRWVFLQAAIWPDLIRSIPKYHKETWHYINKPHFLAALDEKALHKVIKPNTSLDLPDPLTPAARDHLNCVQAFKLCIRELSDADNTDEERAIYFCWLLHIGGDIHQPLHSTSLVSRARFHGSAGDKGGNGIKIEQDKNLHSFWDGLLGQTLSLKDIRERTKAIVKSGELKKAAEAAAKRLAVEDWFDESHAIAKSFVYHDLILKEVAEREATPSMTLRRVDLPLDYQDKASQLARRRVAEAGYRLAEILKQVED